ncbi:MAG: 2-C-methyl-D-erythritol 2,4-cyclodiphosphate synthase [Parvibaculales bacterium]
MQKEISSLLDILPANIGLKASTTEGMGWAGRGEGIAAQIILSVREKK